MKGFLILAALVSAAASAPVTCPSGSTYDASTLACVGADKNPILYIPGVGFYKPGEGYVSSESLHGVPAPAPPAPEVPEPMPPSPENPVPLPPYPGYPLPPYSGNPVPVPPYPGNPVPLPPYSGNPVPMPPNPAPLADCLSYPPSTCPHSSPVNVLLAHPSNPSHFCQCANGTPVDMSCAPGTIFDPVLMVCD